MAASDRARKLLLALIYPVTAEDFTTAESTAFEDAVTEQVNYEADYREEIRSETLGDVSVTYANAEKRAPLCYYGTPISPLAVTTLTTAGLMRRWI